jgi:hypothetical protein
MRKLSFLILTLLLAIPAVNSMEANKPQPQKSEKQGSSWFKKAGYTLLAIAIVTGIAFQYQNGSKPSSPSSYTPRSTYQPSPEPTEYSQSERHQRVEEQLARSRSRRESQATPAASKNIAKVAPARQPAQQQKPQTKQTAQQTQVDESDLYKKTLTKTINQKLSKATPGSQEYALKSAQILQQLYPHLTFWNTTSITADIITSYPTAATLIPALTTADQAALQKSWKTNPKLLMDVAKKALPAFINKAAGNITTTRQLQEIAQSINAL